MYQKFNIFLFFSLILLTLVACNQDEIITDSTARLHYSADTITFDTVFTTIGTVTKGFKVYNQHDKYIRISRIYLREGGASNFRVSVDGANEKEYTDIEIAPNDSIYIFVEATLDPVSSNLPLVVEDAIVFQSNENDDEIILEAFGQNVHLYNNKTIDSEKWLNDKPYLIYGNLTISEGQTLQISRGAKIYLHYNSSIEVQGNILAEGTLEEPVIFEGDRFDYGYDKSAGRWGTIFFDAESQGNRFEYTTVKNAVAGMQAGYPNEEGNGPSLELINTQILNSSFAGIIAYGAQIEAYNCIIADAQYYGLVCFMGGKYNFYHSTISINGAFSLGANIYESYTRIGDGLAVALLNSYSPYYTLDENYNVVEKELGKDLSEANFYNCIIYGNSSREFNTIDNSKNQLNFFLDHCIIKSDSLDIEHSAFVDQVILNEDPRFVNDSALNGKLDFRLDTLSPAKDFGSMEIIGLHPILETDYNGNSRIADGKPDLGAFERIE
jgi:hypothetical protein